MTNETIDVDALLVRASEAEGQVRHFIQRDPTTVAMFIKELAAALRFERDARLWHCKRESHVAYECGLQVAITELLRHADGHGAIRSGHSETVTRSLAALLASFQSGRYRTEAEVFADGEKAGREAERGPRRARKWGQ